MKRPDVGFVRMSIAYFSHATFFESPSFLQYRMKRSRSRCFTADFLATSDLWTALATAHTDFLTTETFLERAADFLAPPTSLFLGKSSNRLRAVPWGPQADLEADRS